jgi:hypothetical protein
MSVYFEHFRELVPLRVSTGQALHAILDPTTKRVAAFTNFSLVPRIVKENLPDSDYEIKYNVQKILLTSGGEVLRPRIKAREFTPWAFGIRDETIYDADSSPLDQETTNKFVMIGAQTAAVDFVIRVVNAKRREFNNISIFGQDRIYTQKLREAVHVRYHASIGEGWKTDFLPYLKSYAEVAGIDMLEAANRVFDKSLEEKSHLIQSENDRMIMMKNIFKAQDVDELKEMIIEFAEKNEGLF